MNTEIWALGLVFFTTFTGAFAGFQLKKGSSKFSISIEGLFLNEGLILGVLLYVFSSIFFIIALKGGELTALFPITSLTYIWTTAIGIKIIDEKLNRYKIIGISLIVLGVVFIVK